MPTGQPSGRRRYDFLNLEASDLTATQAEIAAVARFLV